MRKAIHNLEAKFTWKPPFASEDESQEQDITLEDIDKAFDGLDQWFREEQVAKGGNHFHCQRAIRVRERLSRE